MARTHVHTPRRRLGPYSSATAAVAVWILSCAGGGGTTVSGGGSESGASAGDTVGSGAGTAEATGTAGATQGGTTGTLGGWSGFYFVLHADPARGQGLADRWDRLVRFMDELAERNADLSVPHHVTIMLTPNWGRLLLDDAAKAARVGQWIAAGHEMAFHSHTHNHAVRDGYTNAVDRFGPDEWTMCVGDPQAGDCTLDAGLAVVQAGLDASVGGAYDIRFATIGPHSNEGDVPGGRNDCPPLMGAPAAEDEACIDGEWTSTVDETCNYEAAAYPGLSAEDTDDPASLLGASFCERFGDAQQDIYALPIAPFETESGALKVSLDTVSAALAMASGGDMVGVVIHPASYVDGPSATFPGDARATVRALFDAADGLGIVSRTLSEVRAADTTGPGVACKDLR